MSDVANTGGAVPAPQPEPLIFFQGQPFSRESAGARRAELLADKSFADAATRGSPEHQQELAALWQIEHYGSAPTPPPKDVADVQKQADDRASRERVSYGEHLHNTVGFSDQQIHEIINQRPLPIEERRWHQQQVALLKQDREFVAKYLKGDRESVLKMRTHVAGAALPVGSLDQIKAWEAAHPFRAGA